MQTHRIVNSYINKIFNYVLISADIKLRNVAKEKKGAENFAHAERMRKKILLKGLKFYWIQIWK